MSTTLTRPAETPIPSVAGLRLDPIGRRRRSALAVGSLALVIACVAVFVNVYLGAGDEQSVLAVARPVPQGAILGVNDLRVVRISTHSGVSTVPASDSAAVLGRRAAETLEPNTLISIGELVISYSPPAGEAIVGVAAKEGQLPASGVVPGESVDVVLTGVPGVPDSTSSATDPTTGQSANGAEATSGAQPDLSGTVLVHHAKVLEVVRSPSSSGTDSTEVSLLTPASVAPLVARAAAAGQVALVVVAQKS